MMSRTLAIALVAGGCMTAAAGGSYLAVRHNVQEAPPPPVEQAAPAVNESEGVVTPVPPPAIEDTPARPAERAAPEVKPPVRRALPRRNAPARRQAPVRVARQELPVESEPAQTVAPVTASAPAAAPMPEPAPMAPVDPPAPAEWPVAATPPEPLYEEIHIPASSVIGLELESTVTSEHARIEDRVEARVTRDVFASGRLAIPAGSRVSGVVTMVERGGKVKERARLGVRFHTLVLANGRQIPLRTETIYREGESPAGESTKKIGGAAIGGAVLGAIIGGKKGAIAGATAGAAGGTAVVMAGDRNHASLPAGSIVTVKLAAPVSFEVER